VTAVRYGRRVFAKPAQSDRVRGCGARAHRRLSIVPVLFGWPMLLMPVHILFLQLNHRSDVFGGLEAEPLEPDAMQLPPRPARPETFRQGRDDPRLWQGSGLLLLLSRVFGRQSLAAADGQRDDIARR